MPNACRKCLLELCKKQAAVMARFASLSVIEITEYV
jgi:hypothetical protein